ncbi:branched-chain amino acid transport system ATP-binding protein [Rhodoligotrophos appendicifer]|uniref:ABC transporter ATP-binding protein n=1 Tax=Rhodoligotrophos appendicifer TaxID=987056 RepID=UPI001186FB8F|nr:ABC transporter ATP-binding protein [Rhodoligotrophos appendicifer]
MLELRNVQVSYGAVEAVRDVSITAAAGSMTAILRANGAGKSSLLRAISGVAPLRGGTILMNSQDISKVPAEKRAKLGLAHAMEGRRLFRQLTVEDNLKLAWSFGSRKTPLPAAIDDIYGRFPILAEKAKVQAGYLSGGQQQMVILSCATIRDPDYLLLDEPSLGLAPIIVTQIYEFITGYARRSGATVVIAEQMATLALKVSDRGYVLRRGKVVLEGESKTLLADGIADSLSATYL